MIEMNCPHCDHLLRIKDKYAGQKGGCKHCRGVFRVTEVSVPTPVPQGPAVPPPPITASKLDDLGGMPALDPEFAQKMAGIEVEAPTSLADLKDEGAGGPSEAPMPRPRAAQTEESEGLGCLFWGTVCFVPPAGLVWSLLIPSGHPGQIKAIVISFLFCGLAVLCLLAGVLAGGQMQSLTDSAAGFAETMPAEAVAMTPREAVREAPRAAYGAGDSRWAEEQRRTGETDFYSGQPENVIDDVPGFLAQYFSDIPVYPGLMLYAGSPRYETMNPFDLGQDGRVVFVEGTCAGTLEDISTFYFDSLADMRWGRVRKGSKEQTWVWGWEQQSARAFNARITRIGPDQTEVCVAVGFKPVD